MYNFRVARYTERVAGATSTERRLRTHVDCLRVPYYQAEAISSGATIPWSVKLLEGRRLNQRWAHEPRQARHCPSHPERVMATLQPLAVHRKQLDRFQDLPGGLGYDSPRNDRRGDLPYENRCDDERQQLFDVRRSGKVLDPKQQGEYHRPENYRSEQHPLPITIR